VSHFFPARPFKTRDCPSIPIPSIDLHVATFDANYNFSINTNFIHTFKMGYPDTTDAFAITDIKNWSTFTRKEVSKLALKRTTNIDNVAASPQEVRGA
jgi:hypothetical protein